MRKVSVGVASGLLGQLVKDFVEQARDLFAHLAVLVRGQVLQGKEGAGNEDEIGGVGRAELLVEQQQGHQPVLEHKAIKVALGEKAVVRRQFVAPVGQKSQGRGGRRDGFLEGFEELQHATQRAGSALSSLSGT